MFLNIRTIFFSNIKRFPTIVFYENVLMLLLNIVKKIVENEIKVSIYSKTLMTRKTMADF